MGAQMTHRWYIICLICLGLGLVFSLPGLEISRKVPEVPMTKLTSNIKWVEHHYRIRTGYCSSVSSSHYATVKDVHLARLCFHADILRFNQFGLELSPPLHGVLDPLLSIFKLPFRSSHVSWVSSWVGEETLFPEVIVVGLGELDGLGVLGNQNLVHI